MGPRARALRSELRRLFHRPFDDLATVVINAALVCGGWFLLPPGAKNWLFSLTGPMAFAVVLESWMLSDTPATNMLANDARLTLAAIHDPPRLQRVLRAKAVALALVVAPACAVVAVVVGARDHRVVPGLLEAGLLLVLPFGALALALLLGMRWPYHPRPIAWRRKHLRPWRRTARWLVLLVVPYAVVPALLAALVVPPALVVAAMNGWDGRLSTGEVALAAGMAAIVSLLVFVFGTRAAVRYAGRRGALVSYLADPDLG